MKSIKQYLIVFVIIFIFAFVAGLQNKRIKIQNDKIVRLTNNIEQLLQENVTQTTLFLIQQEVMGQIKFKRDSLANLLKIRPATIIKYIETVIIQHDTSLIEVPVLIAGQNFWKISDIDKCFTWKADAFLKNDSLSVQRTLFNYHNKIYDIFWWKRKFPLIGKKKYYQKSIPECGEVQEKIINFVRK